jgi:hypothetical protein
MRLGRNILIVVALLLGVVILRSGPPGLQAPPFRLVLTPGAGGCSTNGNVFVQSSLIHYWPMNETGSTRLDVVGNVNLPESGGPIGYSDGIHSNAAMTFTGNLLATNQLLSYTNFAISWWVKTTNLQAATLFWYLDNDLGGKAGFQIGGGSSTAYFWVTSQVQQAESPIISNAWVHIVGQYDSTNMTLWINGALGDTEAVDVGTLAPWSISIVGITEGGGGEGFTNVLCDELAIWNRWLTPGEIEDLYNCGVGTFYVGESAGLVDDLGEGLTDDLGEGLRQDL